MQVNEAKRKCKFLIENLPELAAMLWGAPGIGKSQIIRAITDELGIGFKDVRLAQLNPVDLRGIPFANFDTGRAEWLTASFLPDEARDGKYGILLLDEISSAVQAIQVAAYQLILDRRCGDYIVPAGWTIIAAGNRKTDRGVVHNMSSALANRLLHFELEPDLDDWKIWAYKHEVNQNVISFLNWKPSLLYVFPKETAEIKGFPSPRTWEFCSKILKANKGAADFALLEATIGEGAATEFVSYLEIASKLPDIEQIVNTGKGKAEGNQALKYAICGALVSNLISKHNAKKLEVRHIDNILKYMSANMPPEMQTMIIFDIAKTDAKSVLGNHPSYSQWLQDNVYILNG